LILTQPVGYLLIGFERSITLGARDIHQIVIKIQDAIVEMCIVSEKTVEEKAKIYDALFNILCDICKSGIQDSPSLLRSAIHPVQFESKIPYPPIDIFTANYDLCVVNYLKSRNIPFITTLMSKSSKVTRSASINCMGQ